MGRGSRALPRVVDVPRGVRVVDPGSPESDRPGPRGHVPVHPGAPAQNPPGPRETAHASPQEDRAGREAGLDGHLRLRLLQEAS